MICNETYFLIGILFEFQSQFRYSCSISTSILATDTFLCARTFICLLSLSLGNFVMRLCLSAYRNNEHNKKQMRYKLLTVACQAS